MAQRVRYWTVIFGWVVLACAGCTLPQPKDGDAASGAAPSLHRDLIVGMLEQKQYYAALAHVQQQQNQSGATPELRYYEAEARRRLGQTRAADALYRDLLKSDYAAQAYHGLGLLQVKTDLKAAVQLLQQAVQRQPTDTQMRNDLGYALMMAGRYQEALPQMATAVELDPGNVKSVNNLIVLLLLRRDEAGARRVAEEGGISAEALAALRKQAQALAAKPRQ